MRKKITLVASLAFAAALCAGVAGANVTAQAETDWANFKITEASVRLGDNTAANPTGLRFKVDCPEYLKGAADTECYTVLSFTSSVQGEAKEYEVKVPATSWRQDQSGWNAVLLAIPASDYVTEVTAVSYVEVAGQVVHTSNEATTSIAKTSSKLLAAGKVDTQLDAFVEGAVDSVTLDQASATFNQLSAPVQLTATVEDGYAVTWKSSNEAVATVDKNGNVTAVGNGSANVTASVGSTKATFAVTAENMPITFSEENPAPVLTVFGASAASNGAALSVVDFNGGKVYGATETGITGRDTYFQISYATIASYFEAYPTAAAISFNTYATNRANSMRVYLRETNATEASEYKVTYLGALYDAEKVMVDDATYYKNTFVINRAYFENTLTADVDVLFRYYAEINTLTTEFYVDNFGMITEFTTEYDFEESGYVAPVAWLGSSQKDRNGTNFATITVKDANNVETTTRALTANQTVTSGQTALNSSTTYWAISRDYLDMVFADPNVTHFQFDLIGDWTPNENFKIQDNTYTGHILLQGYSTADPVTVDGKEGFYKFTVVLPRETYETDGTKDANLVTFRYLHGGNVDTSMYLDNFKGVSAVFDPAVVEKVTVDNKKNSETKSVFTTSSNNFTLKFNNAFLYEGFVANNAQSMTFTLSVEGYAIHEFENNYRRICVWYNNGSQNTYQVWHYLDYTVTDGVATFTLTREHYLAYFNDDGTLKSSLTIGSATCENLIGIGLRLIATYESGVDGEGNPTYTRIPGSTVWTMNVSWNK